jgi:hypothetical protein
LEEQNKENFEKYRYLNERYEHLEQLKERNIELEERKREMRERYVEVRPSKTAQEAEELTGKINKERLVEEKSKARIREIDELFERLKDFVANFGVRSGHFLDIEGEVTRNNLALWL